MPPLAAVAANCSAEGNAITGKFIAQHVKSSFVITARGADNLQCAAGGETVIVKVRGQGRVDPPPVRDRGDGTYELDFKLVDACEAKLVVSLQVGGPADITIIDPELEWTIDASAFRSTGRNCPFDGWTVNGRATTTIVGGTVKFALDAAVTA